MARYFFSLVGIVILSISSTAVAQVSMIKASLKSDVRITGPIIRLGDIVELEHAADKYREQLVPLIIGRAPRMGYVEIVKLGDIKRKLRQAFPQFQYPVIWSGADKVQVRSTGRNIGFDVIAGQAGEYLRDKLSNEHRKLTLGVSTESDFIKLPHGRLSFVPRLNTDFVSKKMCVWMDAHVDGVFYRSIPVWFDVEIREAVYQAKYTIENRSTIVDKQFEQVERNITDFAARHVSAEEFKGPLLLERELTKGEVLLRDNVRPVPAVIGGRKVSILVSEGGVRLKIQGIARRDAEIGDYVKIKPLHSDQLIRVRVIGKQLVEVI